MDEGKLLAIVFITIIGSAVGFLCIISYQEYAARQNAPIILITALCHNKTAYEGRYVKLNGHLLDSFWVKELENTEIAHVYSIYTLADLQGLGGEVEGRVFAICYKGSLDQYLHKDISVVGKVASVRSENETIYYLVNVEMIR